MSVFRRYSSAGVGGLCVGIFCVNLFQDKTSPDSTEDWLMYHANNSTGLGCGTNRNVRIQKFSWNANGTPNFESPVKTGVNMNVPSGE